MSNQSVRDLKMWLIDKKCWFVDCVITYEHNQQVNIYKIYRPTNKNAAQISGTAVAGFSSIFNFAVRKAVE